MSKTQSNQSARRTRRKRNKLNPFAAKVRSAIHYTYDGHGNVVIQRRKASSGNLFSKWF